MVWGWVWVGQASVADIVLSDCHGASNVEHTVPPTPGDVEDLSWLADALDRGHLRKANRRGVANSRKGCYEVGHVELVMWPLYPPPSHGKHPSTHPPDSLIGVHPEKLTT